MENCVALGELPIAVSLGRCNVESSCSGRGRIEGDRGLEPIDRSYASSLGARSAVSMGESRIRTPGRHGDLGGIEPRTVARRLERSLGLTRVIPVIRSGGHQEALGRRGVGRLFPGKRCDETRSRRHESSNARRPRKSTWEIFIGQPRIERPLSARKVIVRSRWNGSWCGGSSWTRELQLIERRPRGA